MKARTTDLRKHLGRFFFCFFFLPSGKPNVEYYNPPKRVSSSASHLILICSGMNGHKQASVTRKSFFHVCVTSVRKCAAEGKNDPDRERESSICDNTTLPLCLHACTHTHTHIQNSMHTARVLLLHAGLKKQRGRRDKNTLRRLDVGA